MFVGRVPTAVVANRLYEKRLLVPQRFHRIQARGLAGGPDAEEQADADADADAQHHGPQRNQSASDGKRQAADARHQPAAWSCRAGRRRR